jgi:hypothetical protein
MKTRYTEEEMRELIARLCQDEGGRQLFATALDLSLPQLSRILAGKQRVSPKILKRLGFRRVPCYERVS